MINKRFRLTDSQELSIDLVDERITKKDVIIRPTFLSICAADQRYYSGSRPEEVMAKKLPMSLIHEAVGTVLYDPKGVYEKGDNVVMIPNVVKEADPVIRDNYNHKSYFLSSGHDGFMRDLVVIDRKQTLKFNNNINPRVAVFLELLSVSFNALEAFEKRSNENRNVIGIWGNGNVGFITALLLKHFYPKSKIIVFGKGEAKLNFFSFVDEIYTVDQIPEGLTVDHAFECVGGSPSEEAINQIIERINAQGSINLMGVSEYNVALNTRDILAKGLVLMGHSRSNYSDFENSIKVLEENPSICSYLENIISEEIEVKSIYDIHKAFDINSDAQFKTVMNWKV